MNATHRRRSDDAGFRTNPFARPEADDPSLKSHVGVHDESPAPSYRGFEQHASSWRQCDRALLVWHRLVVAILQQGSRHSGRHLHALLGRALVLSNNAQVCLRPACLVSSWPTTCS